MPTYDFKNLNTEQVEEHRVSISEYDNFMKANPHLIRYYGNDSAPKVNFREPIKIDGGFKEVLQRIHERTPGSTMDV